MFRLIKKVFVALLGFSRSLSSMVNVSNSTTSKYLNNQSCMSRPTVIDFKDFKDYSFKDMINIKNLDPNKIKNDKK